MLTLLAYGMIIVFLVLLTMKKLNVFSALILVPIVFGIAACLLLDKDFILIFDWIKKGLFFSVNPTTHKVKMGVMSGLVLILFAILYFGIMLKSGLFDPLCIFFIKLAKGDPRASALEHHNGVSPSMFILRSSSQAAPLRRRRKLAFRLPGGARRMMLRTIFLSSERFCGVWSLRSVLPSSPKLTSRTQ